MNSHSCGGTREGHSHRPGVSPRCHPAPTAGTKYHYDVSTPPSQSPLWGDGALLSESGPGTFPGYLRLPRHFAPCRTKTGRNRWKQHTLPCGLVMRSSPVSQACTLVRTQVVLGDCHEEAGSARMVEARLKTSTGRLRTETCRTPGHSIHATFYHNCFAKYTSARQFARVAGTAEVRSGRWFRLVLRMLTDRTAMHRCT